MMCTFLGTNSDYFHTHYKLVGFCSGEGCDYSAVRTGPLNRG